MPDSPFKERIKNKSVVLSLAAGQLCLNMLCVVLYASICAKGHFGNKVKRNCLIAVFNRSYDRLKIKKVFAGLRHKRRQSYNITLD